MPKTPSPAPPRTTSRTRAADPAQLSLFGGPFYAVTVEPATSRVTPVAPAPIDTAAADAAEAPAPDESPDLATLTALARARTFELWELARSRWRIDRRFTLAVEFDLRGRTVGKAIRHGNALAIRYNAAALAQNWRDMRDETIPHEVAHLVCFARPKLGRGHDAGWQSVCVELGGKGGRCYGQGTYELAKARRTWRYGYKLDSGAELSLSLRHHRHLRQGGELHLRRSRERILARHWTGARELT